MGLSIRCSSRFEVDNGTEILPFDGDYSAEHQLENHIDELWPSWPPSPPSPPRLTDALSPGSVDSTSSWPPSASRLKQPEVTAAGRLKKTTRPDTIK